MVGSLPQVSSKSTKQWKLANTTNEGNIFVQWITHLSSPRIHPIGLSLMNVEYRSEDSLIFLDWVQNSE